MVRMKVTPRKGREREREMDEDQGRGPKPSSEAPTPVDPPAPVLETPPDQDEMRRRVAEAEQLEEVGRSPQSLPTQQMAAEAGPSTSGGKDPARKKLHPTVRGKASRKEFLTAGKLKKPQRD